MLTFYVANILKKYKILETKELLVYPILIEYIRNIKKNYIVRKMMDDIEEENNSHLLILVDADITNSIAIDDHRIIDIDLEDDFLNWISDKYTSKKHIQIMIYGSGGMIESSDAIFKALLNYDGKITSYVNRYAYSAHSMIALATDKIFMEKFAYLGPVDPQIDIGNDTFSSYSFIELLRNKDPSQISDKILLQAYDAVSLHNDNITNLNLILESKQIESEQIKIIINEFGSGIHPHYKQFSPSVLSKMGIKISTHMPKNIVDLFNALFEN